MQWYSLQNSLSKFMPKSFMRSTPAIFLVKSANSLCDYFIETKWQIYWQNGLLEKRLVDKMT
jgi:hypothetical protein